MQLNRDCTTQEKKGKIDTAEEFFIFSQILSSQIMLMNISVDEMRAEGIKNKNTFMLLNLIPFSQNIIIDSDGFGRR